VIVVKAKPSAYRASTPATTSKGDPGAVLLALALELSGEQLDIELDQPLAARADLGGRRG